MEFKAVMRDADGNPNGHERIITLLREACERHSGDPEKIIEVVEDGTRGSHPMR